MPTDYWTQVLAFETSKSTMTQYRLLDDKLREFFKERSLLTEINLEDIPIIKENIIEPKSKFNEKLPNKQEINSKRFSIRQYSPKIGNDFGLNHKRRLSGSFCQPNNFVSIRIPKMQIRKTSLMGTKKVTLSIQ